MHSGVLLSTPVALLMISIHPPDGWNQWFWSGIFFCRPDQDPFLWVLDQHWDCLPFCCWPQIVMWPMENFQRMSSSNPAKETILVKKTLQFVFQLLFAENLVSHSRNQIYVCPFRCFKCCSCSLKTMESHGKNDHVCVKLIAFLEVGKGDEGNPRISDNGRH